LFHLPTQLVVVELGLLLGENVVDQRRDVLEDLDPLIGDLAVQYLKLLTRRASRFASELVKPGIARLEANEELAPLDDQAPLGRLVGLDRTARASM